MRTEENATSITPIRDDEGEVIAFLNGRSAPCPRCTYDLRDIRKAQCPECGEPLILTVGSPRVRFGWLVLAMVPGCFSGVAAAFLLFPISMTIGRQFPPGHGLPWPIVAADIFGFLSAGSVWLMYRHRHRILSWRARRQGGFVAIIWGAHILAFALFLLAMWFWG